MLVSTANMGENARDDGRNGVGAGLWILNQEVPLVLEPIGAKLDSDIEQERKRRAQQCSPDPNVVAGVPIGPDKAGMFLPEGRWHRGVNIRPSLGIRN